MLHAHDPDGQQWVPLRCGDPLGRYAEHGLGCLGAEQAVAAVAPSGAPIHVCAGSARPGPYATGSR